MSTHFDVLQTSSSVPNISVTVQDGEVGNIDNLSPQEDGNPGGPSLQDMQMCLFDSSAYFLCIRRLLIFLCKTTDLLVSFNVSSLH